MFKKKLFLLNKPFVLIMALLLTPTGVLGYVMPAEQLLGLMMKNFSPYKTLILAQSTHLVDTETHRIELTINEKIHLKSPNRFHSQINWPLHDAVNVESGIPYDIQGHDMAFLKLFILHDTAQMMSFLTQIGINLEKVSYSRDGGVIIMKIGDRAPLSPKLIIEKERFLPRLINYRIDHPLDNRSQTVRFVDYRKLPEGWMPFEILSYTGGRLEERYNLHNILVNRPIEDSIFQENGGWTHFSGMLPKNNGAAGQIRLEKILDEMKKRHRE